MSAHRPVGERKAEIVQTALRLAFEVGPEAVSTGMIARELGRSQPSIYKHFPSKKHIWSAVGADLTQRIRNNLDRCLSADCGPVDRLRMQVTDHLCLLAEYPALPAIMMQPDGDGDRADLSAGIRGAMARFQTVLSGHVRTAQEQGIFAPAIDTDDAATLILGIIQSLVLRMILTGDPGILMPAGTRLLNLQLSGFSRQSAPSNRD